MANLYRVQHAFQGSGGTSLDTYVNTFHFYTTTFAPADVATWGPVLAASVHYLWSTQTNGQSVGDFYHLRCKNDLGITKIYDYSLVAQGPGSPSAGGAPIFTITDAALLPAAFYVEPADDLTGLPEEVAVCLSYTAVHTAGTLPRRRGRIYLGPFNVKALADWPTSSFQPTTVASSLMQSMLGSAVGMQSSLATYGFEWRVFSTMDQEDYKITEFSVDNAFDTVRGRGQNATYRQSAAIV